MKFLTFSGSNAAELILGVGFNAPHRPIQRPQFETTGILTLYRTP